MPAMWWLVGVVATVVLVATYLTWVAARVDRLHHRVAAAYSALDAQLARRAAAAVALADGDLSLGNGAAALRDVAREALRPVDEGRELAENQLTRALRELPVAAAEGGVAAELVSASRRVALARQVHTDLVRETLAARRRPVVRLLGLDRRHARPRYFDIEDPVLDG
ncbi:MAG: hypothetical protein ACRDT4_12540 [Micromonosporaceae bacterium]